MQRLVIILIVLFGAIAAAQNTLSDPTAVTLAQQSLSSLKGSTPISDVSLNANVLATLGDNTETATAALQAKGVDEGRIELDLSSGTRVEVRNKPNGFPGGAWSVAGNSQTAFVQHNCWTTPVWFFPILSSLSQATNPNFVFKYIGQELYAGKPADHLRVYQVGSQADGGIVARLSTTEYYLAADSHLPLAMSFSVHPDSDSNTNIPVAVRFDQYQSMGGVLVPSHIEQSLNGVVLLDITVNQVAINTGLQDALFTLQ